LPLAVDKLLLDYDATGRANFNRFVKAFEDFFAATTEPVRFLAGCLARSFAAGIVVRPSVLRRMK
jgi:hypothetical protein